MDHGSNSDGSARVARSGHEVHNRHVANLSYAESIRIIRSPEYLYDMVSDITRMGEWSPVCKACWWDEGAGPEAGAWFSGRNETPDRTWETKSQVTVADREHDFAFIAGRPGALGLQVHAGSRRDRGDGIVGVPSWWSGILREDLWRRRASPDHRTGRARPYRYSCHACGTQGCCRRLERTPPSGLSQQKGKWGARWPRPRSIENSDSGYWLPLIAGSVWHFGTLATLWFDRSPRFVGHP